MKRLAEVDITSGFVAEIETADPRFVIEGELGPNRPVTDALAVLGQPTYIGSFLYGSVVYEWDNRGLRFLGEEKGGRVLIKTAVVFRRR